MIVVKCEEGSVPGHVHIGFHVPVSQCGGMFECRHGVLGPVAGPAPVGEGQWTRLIEDGPGVGGHQPV